MSLELNQGLKTSPLTLENCNMATQEKKKPVHTIRISNVEAAIWENDSEKGTFHAVTVSRKYRKDDAVRNSDSFSGIDLLVLAKVSDLAHTWVNENRPEQ